MKSTTAFGQQIHEKTRKIELSGNPPHVYPSSHRQNKLTASSSKCFKAEGEHFPSRSPFLLFFLSYPELPTLGTFSTDVTHPLSATGKIAVGSATFDGPLLLFPSLLPSFKAMFLWFSGPGPERWTIKVPSEAFCLQCLSQHSPNMTPK